MLIKRSEVPKEATWKLEDMIKSDEAWEELFAQAKEKLKATGHLRGI